MLVVAVLLAACGSADPEAEPAARVSVEDFTFSLLPGGARILTGSLYNPAASPITVAQIQVSLFDENNRRVGKMNVEVRDIPAEGRRGFRAAVQGDEDVHGARVRSVLVRGQ